MESLPTKYYKEGRYTLIHTRYIADGITHNYFRVEWSRTLDGEGMRAIVQTPLRYPDAGKYHTWEYRKILQKFIKDNARHITK